MSTSTTNPFNFLFQGSPPPSVTTETTSEQGFPDWYQDLMRANIGMATSAISQPYQAYPGQQVASPTAPTTQAYNMVAGNVGSFQPDVNQAGSALGQVAQGYNQNTANQYMAPYTGAVNSVDSSIQNLGNQNLLQNVLPGVNDAFTGAGQFGSTRNANFNSLAMENNQLAVSSAQAQAGLAGTQAGMSNYLQGQQNQNIAGQQLGTLGQIQQNSGYQDANMMNQIGEQQQTQNQSNLNVAYQNFQNQQAYPYNNINFLNSIIRGMPAPTQSYGSTIAPQSVGQGSNTALNPSGLSSAGMAFGATGGLSGVGNSIAATPIIPGH